jgi:hypothetical protein
MKTGKNKNRKMGELKFIDCDDTLFFGFAGIFIYQTGNRDYRNFPADPNRVFYPKK